MATFKFYIPAINLMGPGSLQDAIIDINGFDYHNALIVTDNALIVTDKVLNQIGMVSDVAALLAEHGIKSVIFDF